MIGHSRMYQAAHLTLWSCVAIIHHFRSPCKCAATSHSASSLPKPHHPVPMPTVSVRLFRCTGMEAAEMCHHWRCRRGEEFCVWRDAQRKKWVGCRDVYKEELAGAQSPQLAQTLTQIRTHCDLTAEVEDWNQSKTGFLIKQNPRGWILNSFHCLKSVWNTDFFFLHHLCLKVETADQINLFQQKD